MVVSKSYYLRFSYLTLILSAALLATVTDIGLYAGATCISAALFGLFTEGSARRQLPDRVGTGLVLVLVVLFLLIWKYGAGSVSLPINVSEFDLVALLLLASASVKAVQVKLRRDWVFIYLLSFFQVLLTTSAAFGLLQSLLLLAYLTSALATLVCFANRDSAVRVSGTDIATAARVCLLPAKRMVGVVICLVSLIFALAVPIFLLTPRLERTARARIQGGANSLTGFSGRMALGQIGSLQQSDDLVMRVRVDGGGKVPPVIRWRGTAFDNFDGKEWRRTATGSRAALSPRTDFFDLGATRGAGRLTGQTIILEPLDTPVLFAAPRAAAIEGSLSHVYVDGEDGLMSRAHTSERIVYRAYSDFSVPPIEELRTDQAAYASEFKRYLQSPKTDLQITNLAADIARTAAPTRYDLAIAVEAHLRENYRYSLDMSARGDDPLADFLFNVRAGHCEYFASAMALMLRTRGVATRVVNGFQAGRYNSKADAYIVRQRDAHAWVEVYFPQTNAWVAFDPTPYAEHPGNTAEASSSFDEYAEAAGLLWTQYVSSYGRQEQRALVSRLKNAADSMIALASSRIVAARGFWQAAKTLFDDESAGADRRSRRIKSFAVGAAALLAMVLSTFAAMRFARRRDQNRRDGATLSAIESINMSPAFYRRMLELLSERKRSRQLFETPREFAESVQMPEVRMLTDAYHRVRYGGEILSEAERENIDAGLKRLAKNVDSDSHVTTKA